MPSKTLLAIFVVLVFAACKKDKKATASPAYNVTGNWSISAYETNYGVGVNATVVQYPCLAGNILTFYADSTLVQSYTGTDTCFITPTHITANGAQYYGLPQQGPSQTTWSMKGGNIYVAVAGNAKPVTGSVISVNGKMQLTLKDTVIIGANTYYVNTVAVKE